MQNKNTYPVIDLYPWPNGLGFTNADEWWTYVGRQNEEDKLDLLITLAHLNQPIGQLLLAHDQLLFSKFQLAPTTIKKLCTIHASSLSAFAAVLIEIGSRGFKGSS